MLNIAALFFIHNMICRKGFYVEFLVHLIALQNLTYTA